MAKKTKKDELDVIDTLNTENSVKTTVLDLEKITSVDEITDVEPEIEITDNVINEIVEESVVENEIVETSIIEQPIVEKKSNTINTKKSKIKTKSLADFLF